MMNSAPSVLLFIAVAIAIAAAARLAAGYYLLVGAMRRMRESEQVRLSEAVREALWSAGAQVWLSPLFRIVIFGELALFTFPPVAARVRSLRRTFLLLVLALVATAGLLAARLRQQS
jgi:hypothetical protein